MSGPTNVPNEEVVSQSSQDINTYQTPEKFGDSWSESIGWILQGGQSIVQSGMGVVTGNPSTFFAGIKTFADFLAAPFRTPATPFNAEAEIKHIHEWIKHLTTNQLHLINFRNDVEILFQQQVLSLRETNLAVRRLETSLSTMTTTLTNVLDKQNAITTILSEQMKKQNVKIEELLQYQSQQAHALSSINETRQDGTTIVPYNNQAYMPNLLKPLKVIVDLTAPLVKQLLPSFTVKNHVQYFISLIIEKLFRGEVYYDADENGNVNYGTGTTNWSNTFSISDFYDQFIKNRLPSPLGYATNFESPGFGINIDQLNALVEHVTNGGTAETINTSAGSFGVLLDKDGNIDHVTTQIATSKIIPDEAWHEIHDALAIEKPSQLTQRKLKTGVLPEGSTLYTLPGKGRIQFTNQGNPELYNNVLVTYQVSPVPSNSRIHIETDSATGELRDLWFETSEFTSNILTSVPSMSLLQQKPTLIQGNQEPPSSYMAPLRGPRTSRIPMDPIPQGLTAYMAKFRSDLLREIEERNEELYSPEEDDNEEEVDYQESRETAQNRLLEAVPLPKTTDQTARQVLSPTTAKYQQVQHRHQQQQSRLRDAVNTNSFFPRDHPNYSSTPW